MHVKIMEVGKNGYTKGVAIPYIIALILGLAVVAVLGYWFFFLSGRLAGSEGIECESKLVSYCQAWKALGYTEDKRPIGRNWTGCESLVADGIEPTKDECTTYVPE